MVGRRSATEADRTKARILDVGIEQASAAGLTRLTIGPLATAVAMSKAGVIGPFRSREGLQRAVLDQAAGRFIAGVVAPTSSEAAGLPRLRALIDCWVDYLAHGPFTHGCFITATSCEVQGQPGPLLDRTIEVVHGWREMLRDQVRAAQTQGDITASTDPQNLITALVGLSMACNQEIHLLRDDTAANRARKLMHNLIDERRPRQATN